MINDGDKPFPGGKALIRIIYNAPQSQTTGFNIPKITKDSPVSIELPPRTAISDGCASFLFESITADNDEDVEIFRDEGKVDNGNSFWDIFIETYTDFYTFLGVVISALALGILAFLSAVQLYVINSNLAGQLGLGTLIILGIIFLVFLVKKIKNWRMRVKKLSK